RCLSDWSSDVCSSDLRTDPFAFGAMPSSKETGRSWAAARPSRRWLGGFTSPADYAGGVVSQVESISEDWKIHSNICEALFFLSQIGRASCRERVRFSV